MKAYQRQLEAEQPTFLRKKAEKLRSILKEEEELGLEVTVTEKEIKECLDKADAIEQKLKSGDNIDDEEYLIYKEEAKPTDLSFNKSP